MASVVVDSNVLIAARIASDRNHELGNAITAGIDTGELPAGRILDDVISEVLNYLQVRAGHQTAIRTLDAVLATEKFELERTTNSDFDAGRSLFRRYEGLSFTDAVIAAYMQRTGMEYVYSFDDDFDAVPELTRLDVAENPFT